MLVNPLINACVEQQGFKTFEKILNRVNDNLSSKSLSEILLVNQEINPGAEVVTKLGTTPLIRESGVWCCGPSTYWEKFTPPPSTHI